MIRMTQFMENTELITRNWIKNNLSDCLSGKAPSKDLDGLKGVLFNVIYPLKP
jgi:hypothetical protein